ncbi:dockerin type 1 [Paenibacillus sp. FSL H8-0548]|nr:dockerin type 1 [Paenibacillus sp. FSL H8-0548]
MALLVAAAMTACSTNTGTKADEVTTSTITTVQSETGTTSTVQLASIKLSDLVKFDEDDSATAWSVDNSTAIELNGTNATVSGSGAEATNGTVSITAAGTYVLSGTLSDGQIVVDEQAEGTVQLVLNGVNIHDNDSAAIYIKEAGKVIITLQEGTENFVSDGDKYIFADASTDEPSAAIFSKADLTINGTGKLSVTGNYNDGITSKDDLKVMSGTFEIQAADDGLIGKDLVAVQDGKFTIVAGGDGIKSTNDTDEGKGFIAIAEGEFDIQAGSDGIQSENALVVDGGIYTIVTGGGSENGEVKMGEMGQNPRGNSASETSNSADDTETTSAKGLKAGGNININNGTFTIDAADDAIHSNSNVGVANGEFNIMSGDDGIHADSLVSIDGGTINITKSYEGIEGANITITDGEVHVVSSDDGVNVAGGNDEATAAGRQDQFSESATNLLTISGGTLTIDASGDGLDSNGSIVMTGGTVIVNGPTTSGNGPLDYDGSFEQSGGILVAAGSSGMAQAPSDNSSQFSVSMTFPQTQQAGTIVHLADSEGNTIMTAAPSKNYQSVVISSPDLKEGSSYTLYSGGTSTGAGVNGLYTDGEYTGGTKVTEFEISSSVTWLNESGVTTGNANQGPGGGGTRPQGGGRR